jgi:hypothetical protein
MPDKALGPLMAVLPIAPTDVRLNQRLAALHTRAERFADAAVCCRTLETAYEQAGLSEEAGRYGDLAQRCEERAASSPARFSTPIEADAPLPPWPAAPSPEGLHLAESDSPAFEVPASSDPDVEVADDAASEIDLSAEWDGALAEPTSSEPTIEDVTNEAEVEPAVEEISVESSDAVTETIEEIRFYLEHSMVDQARAAFVKLQTQTADYEQLAAIHAEINAAGPSAEPEAAEIEPVDEAPEPVSAKSEAPEIHEAPAPEPEPEPVAHSPLNQMVAELDSSLGDGFLPDTVTHGIEHDEEPAAHAATDPSLVGHLEFMSGPKIAPKPAPAPEPESKSGVLGEFVSDLEESLGDGFLKEAPVPEPDHATAAPAAHAAPVPAPVPERHMAASAVAGPSSAPHIPAPVPPVAAPPAAAASAAAMAPADGSTFRTSVRPIPGAAAHVGKAEHAASVDLADMFGEIRHELEEDVSASEEDPETHYNLGVAFREMGLLDEAIGELQKVCQAVDRGNPFPQVMQTYTWLAQCFLDKGVPEAAIRWYEKALKLPNLDDETRMALHYELGSSYETAGDKTAALRYFMEVYGSNIDYRDVGERIKALKS